MSAPLVLAVPAKGRLQENAEAFFARSGLTLVKPRGARDYRGAIAGLDGVEVAYLSAGEITAQLAAGAVHLGVTGEDLVREQMPDADSSVVLIEGSASALPTWWWRCRRPGSTCAPWPTSTTSPPRSATPMTARCGWRPNTSI